MAGLLDFLTQGQQGGGLLGLGGQQQGGPMSILPPGLGLPQQPQQIGSAIDPNMFASMVRPQAPTMFDNPLVHLGLGLASGSTTGEGIGGALKGLQSYQQQQQQRQQQALQNYVMLKSIEDKPSFGQVGEDVFGNKQYGFINAPKQAVNPYTPGTTTAGGTPAAGSPAGGSDFFAKGVTSINHDLQGHDYLAQFSPEVQAAVKSYVGGESMPTGNPRKGFTQTIKMISQKFGNDIGMPADDASFAQRNQMLKNLAISTPGSLGGQINFAGTSLEHLAATADKINDLNNVNGLGIAPIAKLVNSVRQLTTDQAGKANAVTGAAQHYGQEVTKFYSGSPGGEGERARFMNTLSTSKSPTELADALQTERELIPGRLDQLANQIKTTLGDTPQGQKYLARIDQAKAAIPRIDASIAKLRGQEAPDTGQAPAVAPATPSIAPPQGQPPVGPGGATSPVSGQAPMPPASPIKVTTQAQRAMLPPGSQYIAPDGSVRTKQ